MARQLADGGRVVDVAPERLRGWFERFADTHDGIESTRIDPERVEVRAGDGALAVVPVGFGGMPPPHGTWSGLIVSGLIEHACRSRRVGVILVRLGAHSVGIAEGGKIQHSSTDRHAVRGRNKAGGWSQKRYARRRDKQARRSLEDAAEAIARVIVPERGTLDAVILGGDKQALARLRREAGERGHRAVVALLDEAEPTVLDLPEPRRAVLDQAAVRALAVPVKIHDTARDDPAR